MKKELISLAVWAISTLFAPAFAQNLHFFKKNVASPPEVVCKENFQIAIGPGQSDVANCQILPGANGPFSDLPGTALLLAADLDNGSFDPLGQPVFFKIKKAADLGSPFVDSLKFGCGEIGAGVAVVLRAYNLDPGMGAVADTAFLGHFSECLTTVFVADKIKPFCQAPPPQAIFCESLDPLPWSGALQFYDNCGIASIDTSIEYLPSETDFFQKKYGQARRVFTVRDCTGNSALTTQEITVNYREQFRIQFPDDVKTSDCANFNGGNVQIEAIDCENLHISYEDQAYFVVPDACWKIHRFHKVVNLATYNPVLPAIQLTNTPNSNKAPAIWVGGNSDNQTIWAPADMDFPMTPTVAEKVVHFPEPLSDSLEQKGTPAFVYVQVLKIDDATVPTTLPIDYTFCDISPNDPNQWDEKMPYNPWGINNTWDPINQSHDLREAEVDLSIFATDVCSGANVNFRFLIFLDLNGDGVMETTINSEAPTLGFGIREDEITTINGQGYRIGRITRDIETDDGAPLFSYQKIANFTLPNGMHKIKWVVEDGCGNDHVKEYPIFVGECEKPNLTCHNYLKIKQLNSFPTNGPPSVSRTAAQFVKAASDNITPFSQLEFSLRDPAINPGTSFPVGLNGMPVKSLNWGCGQLGFRPLELWVRDQQGNTATCPTAVYILDGTKLCPMDSLGQAQVDFRENDGADFAAPHRFELFQNQPNPFAEITEIGFFLPAAGAVKLRVFDAQGRFVFEKNGEFEAGPNQFFLGKNDFAESRFWGFYQILTENDSASRRFVFEKN